MGKGDTYDFNIKLKDLNGNLLAFKTTARKRAKKYIGVTQDVDEINRKAIELEENFSFIKSMIESTNLGFWVIDLNYKVKFLTPNVNERINKYFKSNFIIGQSVFDIVKANNFLANDKRNYDKAFKGETFTKEYMIEHKGKTIWGSYTFCPFILHDEIQGAIVFATNIDELKSKEKKIKEINQKFDVINEFSNDVICFHDLKGKFTYCSQSIKNILGYNPADLISKHPFELIHPRDIMRVQKNVYEKLNKQNYLVKEEFRFRKKDGEFIWLETFTNFIKDANDEVNGILSISRDISSRIESEKKIVQANDFKTKLISTINHELRQPLTGIVSIARLLGKQYADEQQKELFEMQVESAEKLLDQINELITFSEIESGYYNLIDDTLDLCEFLKKESSSYKKDISKKDLGFKLNINLDEAYVKGNYNILRMIYDYIIKNAIKFTYSGFIEVALSKQKKKFVLEISDTGIGISDEKIKLLSKEYTKLEINTDTVYEGLGLGIYNCNRLVEAIDSELSVFRNVNEGTTFKIEFNPINIL